MEETEHRCPRCGQPLTIPSGEPLDELECPECGAPLDGSTPEPPADVESPPRPDEPSESPPEAVASPELARFRHLLRELRQKRASPASRILWLIISVVVFVTVLGPSNIVRTLFALVPVILFHELGHLAAMKACGYTDVSVFFIPLVGAAAAGKEVRPSQTKRALVSLMGPLPGIILGFVLMFTTDWTAYPLVTAIVELLFLLNLFNLLPIQPLDGGRLLEAIVMSRSAVTAMLFSFVSPVLLVLLGLALRDWVLIGLSVFLFLAAMNDIKAIRAASRLRKAGHTFHPGNLEDLPDVQLQAILDETRSRFPTAQENLVADLARRVHRRLTVSRSSWIAAVGLLGLSGLVVLSGVAGIFISYEWRSRIDRRHKGKRISEWVALLEDPDDATREEAMAVLMDAVQGDEVALQRATVYTIGELGPEGKAAVPVLVAALGQPEPALRWQAAQALGRIGPGAAPALPELVKALGDKDWMVREHAAEALPRLGPAARDALPALQEAMSKEESWVARRVMQRSIALIHSNARPPATSDAPGTATPEEQ